ncbi:hypothetical protein Tco_1406728 [Tanacetum coccineum]
MGLLYYRGFTTLSIISPVLEVLGKMSIQTRCSFVDDETRQWLKDTIAKRMTKELRKLRNEMVNMAMTANNGVVVKRGMQNIPKFGVIMEYLVNISKMRAIWSLNEDILKIYYSDNQYAVSIKEDTVLKWTTLTLLWKNTSGLRKKKLAGVVRCLTGKVLSMVRSSMMKTFTTLDPLKPNSQLVFDDAVTSEVTHSCELRASSLNENEIDFRISFDEFDDEDYMVIYDKNSFSYKIISTNDLKTDLKNDNEKVNRPSFPPPEPTVSCFDDLDFFNDFENEFPAIVYNNAQTSKSDLSTELILSLNLI